MAPQEKAQASMRFSSTAVPSTAVPSTAVGDNTRKLKFVVHLVVPLLLSAAALLAALLRVYSFEANEWDYGLFSSLLWNFAHGNSWHMPLYEGEPRVFFLADHLALFVPLLAPVFILFPSPYTLSALHGLAFAATYFLVPLFVKEVWKQQGKENYLPAALFLLLTLSFSKGFCGAWWFQSHMTTLVMPFVLAALMALHRKALVWAVVFCLLVALGQERSAVAVFGVGMYALLVTKNRRLGFALCAFSALYFFAAVKLVIPSFAGSGYGYAGSVYPFYELHRKLLFLIIFFAGWYFLPLLGRRALLASSCAFPVLGLSLISNRETMYRFAWQYQDLPSVFFLAAATFGLFHLLETHRFQRLSRTAVTLLASLCLLISFVENRRSPLRALAAWRLKPAAAKLNAELEKYTQLPPEIKVYASEALGPRFSMRKHRRAWRPAMAGEHFNSSMVFLALKHERKWEESMPLLLSNPSLVLTWQSPELLVFSSADLLSEAKADAKWLPHNGMAP